MAIKILQSDTKNKSEIDFLKKGMKFMKFFVEYGQKLKEA